MWQRAAVGHPGGRLAGYGCDPVVVIVVVEQGKILSLRCGGDDKVSRFGTPVLALLSEHLRDRKCPFHHQRCDGRLGKRSTAGGKLADVGLPGGEHKLKIHDSAGPDLAGQLELFESLADLID
jgi:hypothetical protein